MIENKTSASPMPPYGTAIRNAVAQQDLNELRAQIGTVQFSIEELVKVDTKVLEQVAGNRLSAEDRDHLEKALSTLRKVLEPNSKL